jgi:hypothetical protein
MVLILLHLFKRLIRLATPISFIDYDERVELTILFNLVFNINDFGVNLAEKRE